MSIISSIASALGMAPAAAASPATGSTPPPAAANIARVRLLSVNDFHGQLTDSDAKVGETNIGGAATLASYVRRERAGNPDGTFFVSAGDMLGAAQPESTLLRHHSTIAVLDAMGLDLATFGNHEFDKGYGEAMRIIYGDASRTKRRRGSSATVDAQQGAKTTAKARGKTAWPGSPFPWVNANVVDAKSKKPVLPPYVIKTINGVKVAFLGATTKDLKNVTVAKGIRNLEALDPADAINRYIPEIKAQGVHTIVVFVHEGGTVDDKDASKLSGPIVDMAERLDPEVDVVISGHSHKEYATTVAGKQVVQAGNYAKALGVVDLDVDRTTGQVVKAESRLVRNDEAGIAPDPVVAKMVDRFHAAVAPQTERVVTTLKAPLTRARSAAGETVLGSVVAEAQRVAAKADIGLMNNGGLRQDLDAAGPVTWGTLFGVQPFGNRVVAMDLTGAELMKVLEQQFDASGEANILQVAGMTVHIDATKPVGQRIVKVVLQDGSALDLAKTYRVSANSFIADGGDGFTELKLGKRRVDAGVDLDALVKYMETTKELPTAAPGRIVLEAGTIPEGSH